jgi:NAD(P)-dependent dehydrogenase (short-subunit alcohol dehydrogenase family)
MRALVTGSKGALGSVVCERFIGAGYDVVGIDLPEHDITDRSLVLPDDFDVCANVAGVFGEFVRADQISTESWDHYLAVNLTGAFNVCQRVLPGMLARGYGRVINVASIASLDGHYRGAHYAASKAALIGLTRSIALEYAEAGITANAVLPGCIATPNVLAAAPEAVLDDSCQWIPTGRFASVEEIASMITFLASEEASYVNGASIPVDGASMLLQFRFARKPNEHTQPDSPRS